MGLFTRKKEVLDLTDRYFRQQERLKAIQDSQSQSGLISPPATATSQESSFGFFGSMANVGASNTTPSSNSDETMILGMDNTEDKRKKLAKRILDMTTRIEDMSNQIYHMQQRLEVLERKFGTSGF